MKILIDECLPDELKGTLATMGHECQTVRKAGYGLPRQILRSGLGPLPSAAASLASSPRYRGFLDTSRFHAARHVDLQELVEFLRPNRLREIAVHPRG